LIINFRYNAIYNGFQNFPKIRKNKMMEKKKIEEKPKIFGVLRFFSKHQQIDWIRFQTSNE
jgi:hypothetical protein